MPAWNEVLAELKKSKRVDARSFNCDDELDNRVRVQTSTISVYIADARWPLNPGFDWQQASGSMAIEHPSGNLYFLRRPEKGKIACTGSNATASPWLSCCKLAHFTLLRIRRGVEYNRPRRKN